MTTLGAQICSSENVGRCLLSAQTGARRTDAYRAVAIAINTQTGDNQLRREWNCT